MKRTLTVIAAASVMAACTTPYQEMGLLGGVTATRVSDDTAQIVASGNAYTDSATIQRYALRKAAQETVDDGFDLFRIDQTGDTTRAGSESYGAASSAGKGVFAAVFTMPVIKPGQTLIIHMVKGPPPDPMPPGEFDARAVLRYLAPSAGIDRRDCTEVNGKVVCK